jgi:DNA-directed RNA polymerase specialized sigma24 family protein
MNFSPSPEQLHTLLHEADLAARRLVRKLRLPRHDLDDVRQDLLIDALARLAAFDPARGSIGAFVATVMAHKASRIARRVVSERRAFGFEPISIDAPIKDGEADTLADTIANDGGLGVVWGQACEGASTSTIRLDVERCLGALDHRDGVLCAALTTRSVDELAAEGYGSRAGLYRRIQTLRGTLLARGLAAA